MSIKAFNNFAKHSAAVVGSPWAFVLAVIIVMAWVVTGPHLAYSDTWQLIINTGTTNCDLPDGVSHPEYSKS